jgi:hypothetical protein
MKESILSRISALLGMEKVELASMKLMDGVTVLEADAFEPGMEVFIVTEDEQRIALPVGEYELEDERILVVATEGVIAEIKMKEEEAPEEAPVAEEPAAEEPMMEEQMSEEGTTAQPKKVIKSQIEEMLFSKIEELKAENESLKAQLSEQPVVEEAPVVEAEAAAKPISHNPEKQTAAPQFTFGANRKETTMDRILNKLAN